tara:strand:- start:15552 stop:16457 length:906 start_codon:yes stop_codon:yes gene_type:complete
MSYFDRWVQHPQTVWLRKALFQVHLWSGIGVGLYLVVISVTGSILVFRSELRQTFMPQPVFVEAVGERMDSDQILVAAERVYPDGDVSIFAERDIPTQAVTISVNREGEVQQMLLDPFTGADLGHAMPAGWRATTWLLDLHDNLLSGETGRKFNGFGAILMTLLSVTGIIIWWPGAETWRRSLTVDFRANWRRLNWTLHSAIGFWTLLFVFMWGFTGIYLCFPQVFTAFVDYVEPFNMETFEDRVGDAVLYWLTRLHFGRFSMATKILWSILGLVPVVMFVTGSLMWWNRVIRPRGTRVAQ